MNEILSLQFLPQPWMRTAFSVLLLVLGMLLLHLVTRFLLRRIVRQVVERSSADWDDIVFQVRLPHRAALILPLLGAQAALPLLAGVSERAEALIARLLAALMTLVVARVVVAAITAAQLLHDRTPAAETRPIKSYVQLIKVLIYLIAAVVITASLIGKTPWYLLSGLGAMMAVILLIFRDTLLSLVASVQIGNNDLLRVGDWITMPSLGVDGDVVDIALNTVRVQNFDKTIVTVPTYRLVSDSFTNWRGMSDSGGRRIKRALLLDQDSVRFLDDDACMRLSAFAVLDKYLHHKREELDDWNARLGDAADAAVNTRRLTNLGSFRAYVTAYLQANPRIAPDKTLMVRQLAPGPTGLPLEVYCFADTTAWGEYEGIQADLFDHLLAILPEFGLRLFQQPTGADLRGALAEKGSAEKGSE